MFNKHMLWLFLKKNKKTKTLHIVITFMFSAVTPCCCHKVLILYICCIMLWSRFGVSQTLNFANYIESYNPLCFFIKKMCGGVYYFMFLL